MSGYHEKKKPSRGSSPKKKGVEEQNVNVDLSMEGLKGVLKEGLMALCTAAGMAVFQAMLDEEVVGMAGPKGRHQEGRACYRHGYENSSVVLGGRKVPISRPRVRSVEGQEMPIEVYEMAKNEDPLIEAALIRMLHGLSSRHYEHGLDSLTGKAEGEAISKSNVSRRFIKGTQAEVKKLLSRRFDGMEIPVILIDGVRFAEYHAIIAMGITLQGEKQIMGLRIGSTENATICKDLLADLQERGFHADEGILAVIDGSKALKSALKSVFGDRVLVQRCQVHKLRNVLDYLPEHQRAWAKRKMKQAWAMEDVKRATASLKDLATALENQHPDAAASLREGLEETVTILSMNISGILRQTLRSTNAIESINDQVKSRTRNVKNWKNGAMVQRWVAAGLLDAETRFRRVKGYRDLPLLKAEIRRLTVDSTSGSNEAAITRETA